MLRTCSQSLTRTPWLNLTASEFFRGGPSRIVTDLFPVANENLTGCEFFRAPPGFLRTCYSLTRTPWFNLTASEFFRSGPSRLGRTGYLPLTGTPWFNLIACEFFCGGPSRLVADLLPVANKNPMAD